MKPQVFVVKQTEPIDDVTFEFLLQFVGAKKQQRIQKHHIKKDKDLMIIGDTLARYAINKVFGVKLLGITFEINESGKPYLKDYDNIHFNISHSGDYAVCVVCDVPVGIDIQKITEIDFISIVNRHFSNNDIQSIKNTTDKQLKFFELWVQKESYLKMLGTGISDGLDFDEIIEHITFNCFDGYVICVSKGK
jgi:4'-phosphopantetheinyl transferase